MSEENSKKPQNYLQRITFLLEIVVNFLALIESNEDEWHRKLL
jgi:hypothetical protein